jgi:hypothetical protein
MDIQTSLRLPRELYERLSQAAGNRGIGEEIRQRLQRSFGDKLTDPKTRKLLSAINFVATSMTLDGNWHEDLNLFRVFKAALVALLSRFEPPGPSPDARYETFDKDDPPETVGRMYAGFAVRYVIKEEE